MRYNMKSFMNKIAITLTLVMAFALSFSFAGCGDKNEQKDFEFTEEVIVNVNDDEFAEMLLDYYKNYKSHFDNEVRNNIYIENDNLNIMWNEISDKSKTHMQYLQNTYYGNELTQIMKSYAYWILPFSSLAALRAEMDFNFAFSSKKQLTLKYINGVNEQFEILKDSYFKK